MGSLFLATRVDAYVAAHPEFDCLAWHRWTGRGVRMPLTNTPSVSCSISQTQSPNFVVILCNCLLFALIPRNGHCAIPCPTLPDRLCLRMSCAPVTCEEHNTVITCKTCKQLKKLPHTTGNTGGLRCASSGARWPFATMRSCATCFSSLSSSCASAGPQLRWSVVSAW